MLYYRYREYFIHIFVIVVCIGLTAYFIVPQVVTFGQERSKEAAYEEKIALLEKNLATLNRLDGESLAEQFHTASQALPMTKDFVGVLESIAAASRIARVSVDDYSFEIGDLSTESAKLTAAKPFLQLSLTITGDSGGANRFIKALLEQLPLSEVISLSTGEKSSSLTTVFYYKPFVIASKGFDLTKPLSPLEEEDTRFLEGLRSSELPPPPLSVVVAPTATASPQLLP